MTAELLLAAEGISKKFSADPRRAMRYAVRDLAGELGAPRSAGLRRGERWALDDVSFELRRGEALGVVGDNGAGKSTLLTVLAGLLKPDAGRVRARGAVEALIELGAGFNPQLTGRENVGVGAAIRGLDRARTERLQDAVAAFTELGDALDAPVQTYSSGMRARLAYALAASLDPDVLLVDEALAVGDLAFQRKCILHMRGHLERGGALLLVSHNVSQIQTVCDRAILLEAGRITFAGSAIDTLNRMFDARIGVAQRAPGPVDPGGPVSITDVALDAPGGGLLTTNGPLDVTLRYHADEPFEGTWGFSVWTPDLWVCVTSGYDPRWHTIPAGTGELTCTIPRLPLVGGRYVVRAGIFDHATRTPIATHGWREPVILHVRAGSGEMANVAMASNQLVSLDVEWRDG